MKDSSARVGIEQAVVAVDDGQVGAAKKPTPLWKQPLFRYIAMAVLVILFAITALVVAAVVTKNQSQNSSPIVGSDSGPYFRPSTEPPSSTPPPTMAPVEQNVASPNTTQSDTASSTTTTLPTQAPTSSPTTATTEIPPPFAFYVMGDVPYDKKEAAILEEQFANMTANRHPGSAFAVHVGDFQRWQVSSCAQNAYTDFRTMLLKSPVPMFVLAGDNDYLDCPNLEEAWGNFTATFSTIEKNWSDRLPPGIEEIAVNRWWGQRPEMFSFVQDGILFLSVNLLNAPEEFTNTTEWITRMDDNAAWVLSQSEAAFSQHNVRGVVMFSHAEPSHILKSHYDTIFRDVFRDRTELPVLNIHGDGHIFKIDRRYSDSTGWSGFVDVQVDQGGKADPLLVEVAPMRNGVMEPFVAETFSQFVFGDGLFRIDRQKGRYPNTTSTDGN